MTRQPRPLKRKINIEGDIWTYRITKAVVQIVNPDCSKKWSIPLPDFTNMTWDNIERGQWKGWFKLGPGDIADYIHHQIKEIK